MGIGGRTLQKFIDFHRAGIFDTVKSVAEIGSQELFCEGGEEIIREVLQTFTQASVSDAEVSRLAKRGAARDLYKLMGLDYLCIDIDGQFGAIPLDLNFEDVPPSHLGRYDFVTNFGTTEHVANQLNCFKVMHDLTSVGGYMYHELPCQGMLNHGLVNYNPKMFWMLCKSNFYDYVGMWFYADTAHPHKLPDNIVQMCKDLDAETLDKFSSQDSMLAVLVRKKFDAPYVPPLDGNLEGTTDIQKLRYWSHIPGAYEKLLRESNRQAATQPNQSSHESTVHDSDRIKALQAELALANSRIAAMESSKFWKLRQRWFALKRLLGLSASD
ncbi:MAG: class I SAM-dependent methyltransferase [Cyanobacteria bacterium]|nr:class I SAM-dependent methyltransferase [Cyanobacteriota bacterium]MDW8200088.1 hypothetical protein [Cyanobacteriota bacterium SKYGB_h_bin112]